MRPVGHERPRDPHPPLSRRVLGVVLAGGQSSRFGAPKWRAEVAGTSMGARAVAALAPNVERVVALSGDPEVARLGVEVRPDLEEGLGPLGGIRSALEWAASLSLDAAFVLACDLPLVGSSLVRGAVSAWRGEDAVAFFGPRGPEPLCALYSAALLPAVERKLREGERAPRALLSSVRVLALPDSAAAALSLVPWPFLNVNTPDDLQRAEAALAGADTERIAHTRSAADEGAEKTGKGGGRP